MESVELGRTGIRVSRICVGGMSFGHPSADFHLWTLEAPETERMIGQALDLGINFLDTANGYSHGDSERFIGQALRSLRVSRDRVVIASKVYFNEGHLSARAIAREIDGTLARLGTDYLDLYYIHRFDYGTPIEETMQALDRLVRAGKVRALGASAMYGYQFHNMQVCAQENGWTPFSVMQNHYNLLYREDERELIPVCRQYGVSLVPYSPLAGGHLAHPGWQSGSARSETDRVIHAKYDQDKDNNLAVIARVQELARRRGTSMASIALAWHWRKGVAAAIVGATRAEHLQAAAQAASLKLDDSEVAFLEEPYRAHGICGAL